MVFIEPVLRISTTRWMVDEPLKTADVGDEAYTGERIERVRRGIKTITGANRDILLRKIRGIVSRL